MNNFIKKMFHTLDYFLPERGEVSLSLGFVYKARILFALNIVCLVSIFALVVTHFALVQFPSTIIYNIYACGFILFLNLIYIKNIKKNFEIKFKLVSVLQISFVSILVLYSAYSGISTGIFGLVWLFPMIIMSSYLITTKNSIKFFLIFISIVIICIALNQNRVLEPVFKFVGFDFIFPLFMILNFFLLFFMSFLNTKLNEDLTNELDNNQLLLIESAKLNSLGQMASTLAHDINNPLFTLQARLHQIRNLLSREELDIKKCDEIIEQSEMTIKQMSDIARGISNYARKGRVDEMSVEKAADLIALNLEIAKVRISACNIHLETNLEKNSDIVCHPSFFSQIVLNLINNAIDALENNEFKKLVINVYHSNQNVIVDIIDNGPGVPKEIEQNIFKPFYTTKKIGKGTGLGLSISQGLVEMHHGKLSYLREKGMTIFRIVLPDAESQLSDD